MLLLAYEGALIPVVKIGIALTFPLEDLMTSCPLAVVSVSDLEPCNSREIGIALSLRDDALQVFLTSEREERGAVLLDVLAKENAIGLREKRAELSLSVGQRRITEILAVAPEKIEGAETRLAAPKKQIVKLRLAVVVEADDLAIDHAIVLM